MFVSYSFIAFLLVLLVLYYILPKRFQWILLLFASFLFYFYAGITYPIFILATGITIFLGAGYIALCDARLELALKGEQGKEGISKEQLKEEKKRQKRLCKTRKKRALVLCLLFNIGILAVVKYSGFLIDNLGWVISGLGAGGKIKTDFIVPMGISFYTFQAVGYLLDVYWGRCSAEKNFFRFLLFVSFFPQLVQGPISRYKDLSKTLYKEHSFNWPEISFGLQRIIWGYFKKLVVADRIGIAVLEMVSEPEAYRGAYVPIYMVFYAIQLYSDFTGGIDIAIGISQCMGIKLEENFIRPFFSKNIAEYWRRWHISMGTWFRDYVFYPCSLSRPVKSLANFSKKHFGMKAAGRSAVYFSTMTAWLATGIWHGAAWSYVAWGLVNGAVILLSEEFTPLYEKFHKAFPGLTASFAYRLFQVVRTFCLMSAIRMFDNYNSVRTSIRQFFSIFSMENLNEAVNGGLLDMGLNIQDYIIVLAGVLLMIAVSFIGRDRSFRQKLCEKPYAIRYAAILMLFFSVLLFGTYGIGYNETQFIYNQF